MSPEAIAPGSLIFVDTWLEDGRLLGRGERLTSRGFMTVSWYAIEQPDGSHALGDGVAYVYEENRLTSREIAAVRVPKARGAYYWRDKSVGDGLMFVLLLPEGHSVAQAEPSPREAKDHDGRLAVYWMLETMDGGDTLARWQLTALVGDIETAVEQLNQQFQETNHPPDSARVHVADDGAMRVTLRDLLVEGFNSEELDDLAFELNVEVDELPPGLSAKARELVTYLSRRGRLSDLITAAANLRPNLPWPSP